MDYSYRCSQPNVVHEHIDCRQHICHYNVEGFVRLWCIIEKNTFPYLYWIQYTQNMMATRYRAYSISSNWKQYFPYVIKMLSTTFNFMSLVCMNVTDLSFHTIRPYISSTPVSTTYGSIGCTINSPIIMYGSYLFEGSPSKDWSEYCVMEDSDKWLLVGFITIKYLIYITLTTSEWLTIVLPTKVHFILEIGG